MNLSNNTVKILHKEYTKLYNPSNTQQNGFVVKIVDDDLYHWHVAIGNFDSNSTNVDEKLLMNDLVEYQQRGYYDHILLDVTFPQSYPTSPPFIRVVYPRFKFHSGHVTVGGSICAEFLVNTGTQSGWNPSINLESVLLIIRQNFIDGKGRIDFAKPQPYDINDAKAAFQRVANQHGWNNASASLEPKPSSQSTVQQPQFPVQPSDYPPNWELSTQQQNLQHVELPLVDPLDSGAGTNNFNQASKIGKFFLDSWETQFGEAKPNITQIYRIQNLELWKQFSKYQTEVSGTTTWLFHGNLWENVEISATTGCEPVVSELGTGIHTFNSPKNADSLSSPSQTGTKGIFFSQCTLGTTLSKDQIALNPGAPVNTLSEGNMFLLSQTQQIYPEFLIVYSK